MGHWDLLVTHNLSDGKNHNCRPHPRGSVRRASGFVLTGNPEVNCCYQAIVLAIGPWSTGGNHLQSTLPLAKGSVETYFVKYFSNRSCDRFAPSSVSRTDFAF